MRNLSPFEGVVEEILGLLAPVTGVAAVALGGSRALGLERPDSDLDLALYYREATPFAIDAIRAIARRVTSGAEPVVTGHYEWGPWVNGGAWIETRAGKLDLLYRNVDQVGRVIDDARAGRTQLDWLQTPVYGFPSVVYLAETSICVPLRDPEGLVADLKAQVATYPRALRQRGVQDSLWGVEFTLLFARKLAVEGDVYNVAGCLTRAASHMTQALFALNETYFVNDKHALRQIEDFPLRPPGYGRALTRILARPGESAEELMAAVGELEALFEALVGLAGDAYAPRYRLPGRR